jgi:ribosomal protein S9
MSWQPELDELARREELARRMGGAERVARQKAGGRLTVRERIDGMLDPGSFHEIGAIAGKAGYDGNNQLAAFSPANCVFGRGKVNGRPVEEYFKNVAWLTRAVEPLKFTNTSDQLDVSATARGGGVGGQSGAVRMGLSRALSVFNPDLRPALRKNGFLTRDSRGRERKKYGQKGARKRFQFSKR